VMCGFCRYGVERSARRACRIEKKHDRDEQQQRDVL